MSEKILQQILDEIKDMKSNIAEIKKQTKDIPTIKVATLKTKEIVERIESTQENHEQTLDPLSRHSIDQEAELKRIT